MMSSRRRGDAARADEKKTPTTQRTQIGANVSFLHNSIRERRRPHLVCDAEWPCLYADRVLVWWGKGGMLGEARRGIVLLLVLLLLLPGVIEVLPLSLCVLLACCSSS